MKIYITFYILFICALFFGQKGLTAEIVNPGSHLQARDFDIVFKQNSSKINAENKAKIDNIIKDFNLINDKGFYTSLWIYVPFVKDDFYYEKLQEKRALKLLKYLMQSNIETELITIYQYKSLYTNEKFNFISIYYD